VVCVIGVLRRRTSWSVEWWISDLYDLCSRFLCRSPVLETQHVHDSRMVMVRWFFAGKFSAATSGATSCTDCEAGKLSSTAGAATCQGCDAGKYSAAVGVYLLDTHTHTPARTHAHTHARKHNMYMHACVDEIAASHWKHI
jgi:hypothetical protein